MRRLLLAYVTAPLFGLSLLACVGGGSEVNEPGDDDGDGAVPRADGGVAISDGGAPSFDAISFDAGQIPPPPRRDAGSTGGVFYGACLTELAFGQVGRVFNFIVDENRSGSNLRLSFQALTASGTNPPPTVTRSGAVGAISNTQSTSAQNGIFPFVLQQAQLTIPGAANPISGSDAVIEGATFNTRWDGTRHCARLGGEIIAPVAAARTLDPAKNICLFVPIVDGDATPVFTAGEFDASNCPP